MIPSDADAFGAALRDHHAGTPAAELVLERDDGWSRPALDPGWFFAEPHEWASAERDVLARVETGPVLDLGCGAGRHSLYLQRAGLEVTAIDASPGAVEVAKARGVHDVRLGDANEPPTERLWGAVLLMCGNLGLAGTWDRTRALLLSLAEMTTADAVLIGDSVDPTSADDPVHVAYREGRANDGGHLGEVRLRLAYGTKRTPWWDQINFMPNDMSPLVEGTGWHLAAHIRDGADHYVVLTK